MKENVYSLKCNKEKSIIMYKLCVLMNLKWVKNSLWWGKDIYILENIKY